MAQLTRRAFVVGLAFAAVSRTAFAKPRRRTAVYSNTYTADDKY